MPNRYSQLVNPTIVNPISFEDFNRVPMAKAQAQAAGLSATASINTDYKVDPIDLEDVSTAVKAIDSQKNTLINDIMNNGVTNQTINDFITVKKLRDTKYKTFIDQAQQNKQMRDAWKATIDSMVISGKWTPQFAERVKQKEYGKSTLGEDGSINQFTPKYGTKYIDVDKDIDDKLSKAVESFDKTLIDQKLSFIPYAGRIMVVDEAGRDVSSNFASLKDGADLLIKDYTNPDTERGAFAQYTDLSLNQLAGKIQDYVNFYGKYDFKRFGGGRQFLNPLESKETSADQYSLSSMIKNVPVKYKTEVPKGVGGFWNNILKNVDVATTSVGIGFTEAWNSLFDNSKLRSEEQQNKVIKDVENKYTQTGLEKKVFIEANSDLVSYLQETNKISSDLVKKALTGDKTAQDDVFDEVVNHIVDVSSSRDDLGVYIGDYTRSVFGDRIKKYPEEASKDLAALIGDAVVVDIEDRDKSLDDKELASLREALKTNKAQVIGVLPTASQATTDSKGKYRPDLSQGYVIDYTEGEGTDAKIKRYVMSRTWEQYDKKEVGYNYTKNRQVEKYIIDQPIGKPVPIVIVDPTTNKRIPATYRQSPIDGSRLIFYPNSKGTVTTESLDNLSGVLDTPTTKEKGEFYGAESNW